jgi:ankyrin repeat protein
MTITGTAELFAALDARDAEAVRRLVGADPALAAARDPEGLSAVRYAQYRGAAGLVATLLAAGPYLDVWDAAAVGDVDALRTLLDEQPDLVTRLSPDGQSPLGLAVFFDRSEAARFLIARGADLAQRAVPFGTPMPLHSAVAANHVEPVRLLLEHGADPNAEQIQGWRALHSAAQHGNLAIVRALLDAGADPTTTTDAGQRPADVAAGPEREAIVAALG